MKKVQILSFDLIRPGEQGPSLAVGSLMAYLKAQKGYGERFEVENVCINLLDIQTESVDIQLQTYVKGTAFKDLDTLAISCYVWNEAWTHPLLRMVREHGFTGKIVLGGYQISYGDPQTLEKTYPQADIFISGYAEEAFYQAILLTKPRTPLHLAKPVDFIRLPSPYLTGELPVGPGQQMLRLETKRGCPYRCNFCAHRDLVKQQVHHFPMNKTCQELSFFQELGVKKINMLDPIFNMGSEYLSILQFAQELKMITLLSLQTRFELIRGKEGNQFLDYASNLNLHLEFGLQTVIESEYRAIQRPNQPKRIREIMQQLNERGISYEVSLIYGLPTQTLDSFRRSIDFVRENGCQNIVAFPLMLLRGTEIYTHKEKWAFKEQKMGEFHIPTVVASNSFSEREWEQMHKIATELLPAQRI